MEKAAVRKKKREIRHRRVRAKVAGTNKVPRLCVFRSNKYLYVQLIDDVHNTTLVSATTRNSAPAPTIEQASKLGEEIAALAKEKKITRVVFDRGGYMYTGVIAALADGARKGGLKF